MNARKVGWGAQVGCHCLEMTSDRFLQKCHVSYIDVAQPTLNFLRGLLSLELIVFSTLTTLFMSKLCTFVLCVLLRRVLADGDV